MDFIDWGIDVISAIIKHGKTNAESRIYGVEELELARIIYGDTFVDAPTFWASSQHTSLLTLLHELKAVGLIEDNEYSHWKISQYGRELSQDAIPLWEEICKIELESDQLILLNRINELSPVIFDDHIVLGEINQDVLLAEEVAPDFETLLAVAGELEDLGLVQIDGAIGPYLSLYATYKGLIWSTRRKITYESRFIDDLIAEWETTSVDFKRQLSVDTDDEKAEFTKDILGLVNTQASGRRWLIIGFHPKTREYYAPPDERITQDRLEQIIKNCIQPFATIKYSVVEYRDGRIAKLEVIREPTKLPYTVAKNLGSHKKRLQQGQMFVRHGSQTEEPTPAERNAIEAEGRRARGEPNDDQSEE